MFSVLAVVCPPLAIWSAEKSVPRTLTNVALTLCFFVPGVLHALAAVERRSIGLRYDSLMRYLEQRTAV